MAVQDQPQVARPGDPSSKAENGPSGEAAPPLPSVLAVVVTHDPGPIFEQALQSLADQDYARLSVLVVDAASTEDPSDRVMEVLPTATVVREEHDRGFGASANVVLADGMRTALYLFCHDDVALRPDAVTRLVEEVVRSNAAIVGPKVVEWDDPGRLQNVGLAVDKFGVSASVVEPGELDQEQHDAVTDVFAVSGGCTMVRADLFRTIGGFDEGITFRGDDVDLCWRAQLAGARVMVVPTAVVRHHEQLNERRGVDDVRRLRMRHQLRTLLSCATLPRLLRVLPQAMVLAIGEMLLALFRGRLPQVRDVGAAWSWNLRRLGEIRRRRAKVREFRQISDAELHRMHVRGSVRLRAYLRGQIGRHDGVGGLAASGRSLANSLRSAQTRNAVSVLVLVAIVLVVGSRHLLSRSIPAVGEIAPLTGGTRALIDEWWRGWHTRAMGSSAPAPTAYLMLGLAGIPLLGHAALLRGILVVLPLPLAAVGLWRLMRPFASRRASVAATVVYLANPVPYNAYARGSWSTLVVYAAAPWIMTLLARAMDARPFQRASRVGGSAAHRALGLGVLLAVVGAFVPFALVVVWVAVVGLVLGSLVTGDGRGLGRLVVVTAIATVIAIVMHLPWTISYLRGDIGWSAFVGVGGARGNSLSIAELLRFHTGPVGGHFVGFGIIAAASFALVLAQGPRLAWAVRCWFVALAAWGVVWVGEQGWFDRPLPDPGVLLAIAATGLAVAAGLGVAAFESDLRKHRFGWRQLAPASAVVVFAAIVAPLVAASVDGRWHMPSRGYTSTFASFAGDSQDGTSRVLWLGDQAVLPLAGFPVDDRVSLATTDNGGPTFVDRWGGPETAGIPIVRDAVGAAVGGNTSRLGRLLAPFAIRYVVVVEARAPGDNDVHPAPESLQRALGEQLDLEPVHGVDQSLTVYRNVSWAPAHLLLPDAVATDGTTLQDLARTDLTNAQPVLGDVHRDGVAADGQVGAGLVYVASTAAPDWSVVVDGTRVARRDAFGWANVFDAGDGGNASLRYDTPMRRHVLLVAQIAVWGIAWLALGNLRHRRSGARRGGHAR